VTTPARRSRCITVSRLRRDMPTNQAEVLRLARDGTAKRKRVRISTATEIARSNSAHREVSYA